MGRRFAPKGTPMLKLIVIASLTIALTGCEALHQARLSEDIAEIRALNACSGAAIKSYERFGKDPMHVYEHCLDIRLGYN